MKAESLVIATGNAHKFTEIARFLDGISRPLVSLSDCSPVDPPEETGVTFEENALLKARYYCDRLGASCIADDSGLVIDALNGGPGVFSARYAGDGCADADNNAKVLAALHDVPEPDRTARFVCVAAIADPDGREHSVAGTVEGRIAFELRGRNGFGYDPMFIPDGHTKTFGELDPAVKAGISHRSRAFTKLRDFLESMT